MNRTFLFLGAFGLALLGGGLYLTSGSSSDAPATEMAQADSRTADQLIDAARAAFLGEGTAQSDAAGAELILKAAATGDEQAIGYAGTLYMGGIGVEHNVSKAREWLAKSTDAEAQALAEALLTFEAVLATMPEEQAELQKAMDEGDARESIRASFLAALERQKLADAETAAGGDVTNEDAVNDGTMEPEGVPGVSEGYSGEGENGDTDAATDIGSDAGAAMPDDGTVSSGPQE
jgi:TPR repeat protein